jgi:hypothetical protein
MENILGKRLSENSSAGHGACSFGGVFGRGEWGIDTDLTFAVRKIDWGVNNFRRKGIRLRKWQIIETTRVYRFRNLPIIKHEIELAYCL